MMNCLKIGQITLDNPLVLAPLAGITDMAFRLVAKRAGAGLVVSEMVSSVGLHYKGRGSAALLKTCSEETPLSVQLFGADPVMMAEASCVAVEAGAAMLDVNMGCPVKKVIKSGAGIALMRKQELAASIVTAMVEAVKVPVTVKIRLGPDRNTPNGLPFAKAMQDAGAAAVTVHGRFGGNRFNVAADWGPIAEVKQALSVPVIGNGDVASGADAERMMRQTGVDGVMIGRGALGRPWVFREILNHFEGEQVDALTSREKMQVVLEHLHLIRDIKPESVTVREFRKHLGWYSKGMTGGAQFRRSLSEIETFDALVNHIQGFFCG